VKVEFLEGRAKANAEGDEREEERRRKRRFIHYREGPNKSRGSAERTD